MLWSGCEASRTEPNRGHLDVVRHGWDMLRVEARFERQTVLGATRVQPDALAIHVYSATHDTLYAGTGGSVRIRDAALGDAEPFLIEACGAFGQQRLCEQQRLFASPKRLRATPEIEYPFSEAQLGGGRYVLDYVVERRRFGGEGWERIEPASPPSGYLLAYVEEEQAQAVRIPLDGAAGRFDLAALGGYDDFRFALRSRLFSQQEAAVTFDVYASLRGRPEPVGSVVQRVRFKTEAERAEVVQLFARQATEAVARRLDAEAHLPSLVAYVDEWTYDRFQRAYTVELELRWRGRHAWRQLTGTLRVGAAGRGASFEAGRADRRTRRLLASLPSSGTLALGTLQPEPTDASVAEGSAGGGAASL